MSPSLVLGLAVSLGASRALGAAPEVPPAQEPAACPYPGETIGAEGQLPEALWDLAHQGCALGLAGTWSPGGKGEQGSPRFASLAWSEGHDLQVGLGWGLRDVEPARLAALRVGLDVLVGSAEARLPRRFANLGLRGMVVRGGVATGGALALGWVGIGMEAATASAAERLETLVLAEVDGLARQGPTPREIRAACERLGCEAAAPGARAIRDAVAALLLRSRRTVIFASGPGEPIPPPPPPKPKPVSAAPKPPAVPAVPKGPPGEAPPAPPASEGAAPWRIKAEHVVAPGETLQRIARKHGISLRALIRANSLRGNHPIHPGQRLLVPEEPAP